MNLFSSEVFLGALERASFDGRETSRRIVRVDGRRFRLLFVDGEPITRWPFLDFHEVWEGPGEPTATLPYLARASITTLAPQAWTPRPEGSEIHPSPTIRWGAFPTHEAFTAHVGTRNSNVYPDARRKRRKLDRELGPVEFRLHDDGPEVFDACLRWKSRQYRETGLKDLFADPRNVRLFEELRAAGVAAFSSLRAGGVLVAAHLGAVVDGRMYWWVPAYDPAFGRYSPGRVLLHDMLQASHAAGHSEFDFLIGDEAYKFFYATDVRVVAPLGAPPLSLRARSAARQGLRTALQKVPWLWDLAQASRGRLPR